MRNFAHSSAVHSVIIVRGEDLSPSGNSKVVGVCSVDGGPESVGEVSSSVAGIGEVKRLRSYSSSASASESYFEEGNVIASMSSGHYRGEIFSEVDLDTRSLELLRPETTNSVPK